MKRTFCSTYTLPMLTAVFLIWALPAAAADMDEITVAPGKVLFKQFRTSNDEVIVHFGFGPGKDACVERIVTAKERLMVVSGSFVYTYDGKPGVVTKNKGSRAWNHNKGTSIAKICNGSATAQAVLIGWQEVPKEQAPKK